MQPMVPGASAGNAECQLDGDSSNSGVQRQLPILTISPAHYKAADGAANLDCKAESPPPRPRKRIRRGFSHIHIHGPEFPRSAFEGWESPFEECTEADAIFDLSQGLDEKAQFLEVQLEYKYLWLDDFSIYMPDRGAYAKTLTSLDGLQNASGCDEFCFDGILSVGNHRHYVQNVPFSILAIDGYGDQEIPNIKNHICIQSPRARKANIWYQLGTPNAIYRRFYEPFLYLAQFTKYFTDYLLQSEGDVTLSDFRCKFHAWLFANYSWSRSFKRWLATCKLEDFRTTVVAHVGFLWKECHSVDDKKTGLLKHTIWKEIDPKKLTAIPRQPSLETQTVVTPFAYNCFRNMYFGGEMEPRHISNASVLEAVAERKRALGLTPVATRPAPATVPFTPTSLTGSPQRSFLSVEKGDVVCLPPDEESEWKSEASAWFAYVQEVRTIGSMAKMDVLWLYQPQDTTLGNAYYPFDNELFLSDNCACGKDAIDVECATSKLAVSWFTRDPFAPSGFFVRQTFRTIHEEDTYDFVTLKKSDFRCHCQDAYCAFEDCRGKYTIGDTVLFLERDSNIAEKRLNPAQIVDFLLDLKQVVLRRLRRRYSDHEKRRNELVSTTELFRCRPEKIERRCHVRIFDADGFVRGVPSPYNRDGAGDYFYILKRTESALDLDTESTALLEEIRDDKLPPLKQGWDAVTAVRGRKLSGMGIFCGGGNFDRGLEDGDAVDFKFAVDYDEHALHTYRANVKDTEKCQLFLGSVDDYLAQAMAGSSNPTIAKVGDFQVLAAGSPCPGFSKANLFRLDLKALRQCSMVASVLSFVDFYSPEYCLLENVVSLTEGSGPNKDQNVFAQILVTFVAMGYQVQQLLADAESFGSSQGRSRVFVIASVPGCTPLPVPPYTHGRPRNWHGRKLGRCSNGLPYGVRRDDYTPFGHTSPLQATQDLPDIGDSLPQICPAFPDHRTPLHMDNLARSCIAVVPNRPRGMGLVQAIRAGTDTSIESCDAWCSRITGAPREFYENKLKPSKFAGGEHSKVFARVEPHGLFPTMLTAMAPKDGLHGRTLHWDQERTLTVMERRRAQGFLDEEVVVGSLGQQIRIIGNAVDRKVAMALGLSLRQSIHTTKHRFSFQTLRNECVVADESTQLIDM